MIFTSLPFKFHRKKNLSRKIQFFCLQSLLCRLGYICMTWQIYRGQKTALKKLVLSSCHMSSGDPKLRSSGLAASAFISVPSRQAPDQGESKTPFMSEICWRHAQFFVFIKHVYLLNYKSIFVSIFFFIFSSKTWWCSSMTLR